MPSFAVLGHRLRPSVQERAFADTLTLPVLLPALQRDGLDEQDRHDGLVVVVQPLRPPRVTPLPRVRNLRPLLAGALGLTLSALPAADLHGDELPGRFTAIAAQPVSQQALSALPVSAAASADGLDAAAARALPVGDTLPLPPATLSVAPKSPAGSEPRRRMPAKSAGWLEHEWRVAEAMRQRYRELYARRLVDWDAWQAREIEALRARRRWEATQAGRGPA